MYVPTVSEFSAAATNLDSNFARFYKTRKLGSWCLSLRVLPRLGNTINEPRVSIRLVPISISDTNVTPHMYYIHTSLFVETLKRPRRKWNDNIRNDVEEIAWESVDWFHDFVY